MSKKIKLSNRELEVMLVLWKSDEPLAVTDIPKRNSSLNVNTVRVVISNLLKKEFIKVVDVVYHNTVLTRTFEAVLTQEEYIVNQYDVSALNGHRFVAALIEKETSENLTALEELIKEQKDKLSEE